MKKNILAENMLRFGVKNLTEEQIKKLQEQQEDPEEPTTTTKRSISINTTGKQNFLQKILNRQRGGFMGGISYTKIKEKNISLDTAEDVFEKMADDLGEKFTSLPAENQMILAEGFYELLSAGLEAEYFQELSKKAQKPYKQIKNFFKKSQRWKFTSQAPEEDLATQKIKITTPYKDQDGNPIVTDEFIQESEQEFSSLINQMNEYNGAASTIAGEKTILIQVEQDTGMPFGTEGQKPRLSSYTTWQSKPLKKIKTSESTEYGIRSGTIKIPRDFTTFAAGKVEPIGRLVNTILKEVRTAKYTLFDSKGKNVGTMTGQQIVNGGGTLKVNYMKVIGSASNYWNDKTDFTHDNNGNQVKQSGQLAANRTTEFPGLTQNNYNLAVRRLKKLTTAIKNGLKTEAPWLELTNLEIQEEARITDTGGVLDGDPDALPNAGQYADVELSIVGKTTFAKVTPGTTKLKGELSTLKIGLMYTGKIGTSRKISFGLAGGGFDEAQLMRPKPIITAIGSFFHKLRKGKTALTPQPWHMKGLSKGSHDRRTDRNVKRGASAGYAGRN